MVKYCNQCGSVLGGENAKFCSYCGNTIASNPAPEVTSRPQQQANTQTQYAPPTQAQGFQPAPHPAAPEDEKSRIVAGILALVVGGLGIHKFYLGKGENAILYLLFCWTGIPSLFGLIEGIMYLTESDEEFRQRVKEL